MDTDLRLIARRFWERDAWAAGREWFEARAADRPDEALAHAWLAFFVVKESRYDTERGLALVEHALALDPACALAYLHRAMILGALLRGEEAGAQCEEARRLGVDEEHALRVEGSCHLDMWRVDEAVRCFRRMVDGFPGSTGAVLLSTACLQAGRLEDAVEWAREAAAREPDDFRAPTYAGVALAYLGRHEEARRELSRALSLQAASPLVHHTLAWVAFDQDLLEEAEGHLREALRHDPLYVTSRKMLGDVLARTGRPEEARAQYEAALRVFPDYPAARESLAALS